jgi:V/A-type H+-transporting ATPase subunit D
MALKFQYNKTALQALNKQLNIRLRALPTLKNKETALRLEVKRAHDEALEMEKRLQRRKANHDAMAALWGEFDPSLLEVEEVLWETNKIAGVSTPRMKDVRFRVAEFSLFNRPAWFADGIAILKDLASLAIEREFLLRKMRLLDYARKKTTQKLNLYEKVQIPAYEEAILKIKRFLEDEENLSKAAQKIVKHRMEQNDKQQEL